MGLYPADFQRAHGEELLQSYRDALRDAREARRSRLATWLWLGRDALANAVRFHLHERERRQRTGARQPRRRGTSMLFDELRLAVRSLRRSPTFACVAVTMMGLGIGANTAIFDVVNRVLLQPLPYERSDELVWLLNRYPAQGNTGAISLPEFWEYRANQPGFSGMAALTGESASLTGLATPLRLEGLAVSPGYFELLGASPVQGRGFTSDEEEPGSSPVVVISHGLWQTAFGGASDILGRAVLLDGTPFTVVGVMGEDHFPLAGLLSPGSRTDFWVPLEIDPTAFSAATVERHGSRVLGRLDASGDVEMAEAGLLQAVRRVESAYPDLSNAGNRDVAVIPLHRQVAGDTARDLLLLSLAVGFVLLLVCVNLTNLFVVRAEARAGEVAVRAAIGAGRFRLLIHGMAESLVVGLVGGAAGVAIAVASRGVLADLLPVTVPFPDSSVGLGMPVLLFGLGLALTAGGLAGVIPVLRLLRGDTVTAMSAIGRGASSGSRSQALKRFLVIGQVAGAVVLVSGAALMTRSLSELRGVDPGFDAENLHLVQVNPSPERYNSADRVGELFQRIEAALVARPEIQSATASWQTPLQSNMSDWPVKPELGGDDDWLQADPNLVSPAYFATFRIAVVAGRSFEASDLDLEQGPVILNESAARLLFPGQEAVGRRVNLDFETPVWREVIGVVSDIKGRSLGAEVRPQTYLTFAPGPFTGNPELTLTVRSVLTEEEVRSVVVDAVAGVDRDIPIGTVTAMTRQVASTLETERLLSMLLSVFGAISLLLGALGVYGLTAYTVQRRRREIGLRIAIGAEPSDLVAQVIGQGMLLGGIGVAVGLGGALATGRLLENLLFGVTPSDFATLGAVAAAVLVVTGLSCWGPALRAASADPVEALREE